MVAGGCLQTSRVGLAPTITDQGDVSGEVTGTHGIASSNDGEQKRFFPLVVSWSVGPSTSGDINGFVGGGLEFHSRHGPWGLRAGAVGGIRWQTESDPHVRFNVGVARRIKAETEDVGERQVEKMQFLGLDLSVGTSLEDYVVLAAALTWQFDSRDL